MRRLKIQPYLFTLLFLFAILSLPPRAINPVRVHCMRALSKPWASLKIIQAGFSPIPSKNSSPLHFDSQAEIFLLEDNLSKMQAWLFEEERVQGLIEKYNALVQTPQKSTSLKDFYERRKKEIVELIDLNTHAIVGEIIYRDPALWSSFVWLNVGHLTNRHLQSCIVAKNSPVLSNGFLVGIVEEVLEGCSKVRLITDKRLNPSVRAMRGSSQENFHHENIHVLLSFLEEKHELFDSEEEEKKFLTTLRNIQNKIKISQLSQFLAKGELHGMSAPLWRVSSTSLEGIGFNYDFADAEGDARNLRTGSSEFSLKSIEATPILNVGDLLMTTGLDGIFPAGLKVAVVTKIFPLTEGSSSYSIEAKPCETGLNSLSYLTVLPPLLEQPFTR